MRHHAHNCAGGDGRASQGRENGGADRQLVKPFACHSKSDGRVASSRPNGYEISRRYLGVMLWRWVKSQ